MASIPLPITSLLAGFMAILIVALNVQMSIRQIDLGGDVFKNLSDGDGDDLLIRRRIAFLSAVYHIPTSLLLLGLIELGGASLLQVIILAVILLLARIFHVIGSLCETLPKIRTFAMTIQFAYSIVCGIWLMLSSYSMLLIL
jgi:uncharacterized membrane protein YecN with MAPEG domain